MTRKRMAYRDERLDLSPRELVRIVLGALIVGALAWAFMFLVAVSA